jgi:ATP-binding cassette subfamily F protein 3
VADGEAGLFDGDLEDYKTWIETRRPREAVAAAVAKPAQPAAAKPNRKALQSKQAKLNIALAAAQTELTIVNNKLADPATYDNLPRSEVDKLNVLHATLEQKVAELEESWLELEMAIEEA